MNALGYAALDASLDLLLELGISAIFEHVNSYLDELEQALTSEFGFESARGKTRASQSGALSIKIWEDAELSHFSELMAEQGVALSTPDGFVRMAPHWPNHSNEIPRIIAAIKQVAPQVRRHPESRA